ncbi:hypothetical protein K1719_014809 [Acacia pycnantha]|nr:hypothetical protein K1719_014751 [Acacia pycnantha]KAI9114159.1 hypothetical protein K1719_014809 [Acacia pycnantha]
MIIEEPLIHNGAIHFILESSLLQRAGYNNLNYVPCIATHHFDNGITFLNLPKEAFKHIINGPKVFLHMGIFMWGKVIGNSSNGEDDGTMCLVTLVNHLIFKIWVLDDYDSSSWSKLSTIDLRMLGSYVIGFKVIQGDSLVFATKSILYNYDL